MKNTESTLREVYRSMLPYGAIAIITERAGVSRQALHSFLTGKSNSRTIENAVLDYLTELRVEREQKLKNAGLL